MMRDNKAGSRTGGKTINIQIYGRSKCFDTRKAERYFKERKIKFQSIDLDRYGLSKGELSSVAGAVGIDSLLDAGGREYERLNLKYITTGETKEQMLLRNPGLLVSPIVRNGRQATVGFKPEVWKAWE
jgi:arsenate reductase (glutaredoxin)